MEPSRADASGRPVVFTIGHGDRSFAVVEQLLAANGVATLVDVRSEPYSRRAPDFTKQRLTELARVAGLGYRWMGDHLGGRPSDPALRGDDGSPDWAALASDPGFDGAVAELVHLAQDRLVAVLCAELAPEHCHRGVLVAPRLETAGFAVIHILGDGALLRHQLDLFTDRP